PSCSYSGAVTNSSFVKEVVSAAKMRLNRFRHVKVKVGAAGQDDPSRLKRFRWILGSKIDVRLDANEAWTPGNVVDRVLALEPFGVSSIEQPVPHEQVDCLRDARGRIKTPVMLDESLCGMVDALRSVQNGTCDLFNIRLSKCGGFLRSLELALYAKQNGLGYQLGCQVGETGILSAAGRAFACSVGGIRCLEGSYDRYLVHDALTVEDLTFGWKGRAPALSGPGLGVALREDALNKVATHTETLYG
ncbi:MAG: mandelate racemase/muconate lactonizing enzyme family protein, partial [Planctomycetia bacterium]